MFLHQKTLLVILRVFVLLFLSTVSMPSLGQQGDQNARYWNSNLVLNALRLPPPPIGYKPKLEDLDKDGDPDLLFSVTKDNVPVLWIDDNDDIKWNDLEGGTDSDCLLVDRNRDGKYGSMGDFIVDWVDSNADGKADVQVLAEYPKEKAEDPWPYGHYMWVVDTDEDNVFNYIDWNTFKIKAWDRYGISDFFLDYSGKSTFIKTHVATYTMDNLKLNWENPFLFYDPDKDGLSEIAVRLVDSPVKTIGNQHLDNHYQVKQKGTIDWVSISVDLDNDNRPGNEFDFDFTVNFRGRGFNYLDQVHKIKNLRGLAAADTFFMDPRWRQMDELIYTNHDKALELTYGRGQWDKVYFVFDEDDDCNRWERVELLDPLDPFKVGTGKGGIDNNSQSDAAGDRGEWDLDNSGKGKLYISKFDGRLHLHGAEWGAWRIDQNATYYQGGERTFLKKDPAQFATMKYEDSDNNGFLDKFFYDLDGDTVFEDSLALKDLKLDDRNQLIDISKYEFKDYLKLKQKISEDMWQNAQSAIKVAQKHKLNLSWYSKWMQAASISQKYVNGYWLQFYIYRDLKDHFRREKNTKMILLLDKSYYGSNWNLL